MSEFGPLATTVADLGLMLDVLAGTDAHRAVAPPTRPLRVSVTAKPGAVGATVDLEVRAALDATAEALREAGHRVVAADPPWRNGDAGPFLHRFFLGIAEEAAPLDWAALEPRTRAEARGGRMLRRARPVPSGPPARSSPATGPGSRTTTCCSARPWPNRRCGSAPTWARAWLGRFWGSPGTCRSPRPSTWSASRPPRSRPAPRPTACPWGPSWPPPQAARRCCCRWPASSRRYALARHAPLEPAAAPPQRS